MQVAEDNRINQKVLRMMLQDSCAELTIVSDGQQAVSAFNAVSTHALSITLTRLCVQLYVVALQAPRTIL
jgi:CheY-like chemotaxis protein